MNREQILRQLSGNAAGPPLPQVIVDYYTKTPWAMVPQRTLPPSPLVALQRRWQKYGNGGPPRPAKWNRRSDAETRLVDKPNVGHSSDVQLRDQLERQKIAEIRDRGERLKVARHEVGHVVVILEHGGQVSSVSAGPDGGLTTFTGIRSTAVKSAVILAGVVASDEGRGLAADWGSSDREDLITCWRQEFPDADDSDLLDRAWADRHYVESVLSRRHVFVRALSRMLVERGRLGGNEVHDLWHSTET